MSRTHLQRPLNEKIRRINTCQLSKCSKNQKKNSKKVKEEEEKKKRWRRARLENSRSTLFVEREIFIRLACPTHFGAFFEANKFSSRAAPPPPTSHDATRKFPAKRHTLDYTPPRGRKKGKCRKKEKSREA